MSRRRWHTPLCFGLWVLLQTGQSVGTPAALLQSSDWLVAAAHGPDAWRTAQGWGPRSRWLDADAAHRQRFVDACGPACLELLLQRRGLGVRQTLLWNICRLPGGGTSMQRLAAAARRFGLSCSIETFLSPGDLPLPAVLHLQRRHFVVLLGIDADRALLFDPACGRIRVPAAELLRQASGVVLVCRSGIPDAAPVAAAAAAARPPGSGG